MSAPYPQRSYGGPVQRVLARTMAWNVDRAASWEKAPAITGLLLWGDAQSRAIARAWLIRCIETQTSDGCFSYDDKEEYPNGAIKTLTPCPTVPASLGYSLLLLHESEPDPFYLERLRLQADAVMAGPRTRDGGFWERREASELWIDSAYLTCPFLVRYGQATSDPKFIDEGFRQFKLRALHLVDPLVGLARHIWCESPNHYPSSNFTSRGNGWMVMGAADLLAFAPDHPDAMAVRDVVSEALTAMRALQDRSGYLRHVLDDPLARMEASSTLMYAYAAARCADLGVVDASFRESAVRAFSVVAGSVTPDGDVPGVALPPGGPGVQFGSIIFAQGFFLMAAAALRRELGLGAQSMEAA